MDKIKLNIFLFSILLTLLFSFLASCSASTEEPESEMLTDTDQDHFYKTNLDDQAVEYYRNGEFLLTLSYASPFYVYPNRQLKEGYLKEDQTVNDIPLKGSEVHFYFNGQLSNGMLSRDSMIDGITFNADSTILFYENGKTRTGQISEEDQLIGEYTYVGGKYIDFYSNGQVEIGYLSKDYTDSNGITFRAFTTGQNLHYISFYSDGQSPWSDAIDIP